jgi:transketolase
MTGSLDPASWNIETSTAALKGFTMADELIAIADERDDVVVMSADLAASNGLAKFRDAFPHRFINTGIAEQNMMSVAAGIASTGMTVFVSTFASFASLLCAEQIRTDLAYTGMKVRILAHHAGISMGFYGTSHHAVEDVALTRAIANLTVVSPCDGLAIRGMLRATLDVAGPVYMRIGRGAEKDVYHHVPDFEAGKCVQILDGQDATIIATGLGVRVALDAASLLQSEGLSIRVLDAAYIKPLDRDAIFSAARDTGAILCLEEHNPNGGLGGAVAEVLAGAGLGIRFCIHALPDDYALVAPPTHLYRHYKLTGQGVAAAIKELLRK